ncbi:MAG TPA: hypothetical protein VGM20_03270 [Gemmatimonadales bacterium]|jgi:hypothetical protein
MHDDSFRLSTDEELAARIKRAMDGWDTKPTAEDCERVTAEFIAAQRAWERKLAALPPEERARVAAQDADEAQAELAARKRGLTRAEAARLHLAQLELEGARILKRAEARIIARSSPVMSGDEIDALRRDEVELAEAELQAWLAANPPPTLADDERAIQALIGDVRTDN